MAAIERTAWGVEAPRKPGWLAEDAAIKERERCDAMMHL